MHRVVGVVLCGGASSRMGVDKALIGTPERPLAAHVASALSHAGVDEVLLVGGNVARLSALRWQWIGDDDPGSGPLGAIVTVARAEPSASLVVCACDLPLISGVDIEPLLRGIAPSPDGDASADVAVFDVDGVTQWSAIAIAPSATAWALESFESGERSLRGAFSSPALLVRHLQPLRPDALRDVDRPEDLAIVSDTTVRGTGSGAG